MSRGPLSSTIGQKAVMAVSGLILFGFVLAHMAGNLQVFLGAEAFNAYSRFLRELLHGTGLWIARGGLLIAVGLHIASAWSLAVRNRNARPVGYKVTKRLESTYASRTMQWSGPIILLFVIYHLLDLTLGKVNPGFVAEDPYRNVVATFNRPAIAVFYIVAMLALSYHLRHGVWSMLQSVGASHPRYDRWRKQAATAFAVIVCGGFILLPVAVLAGFVK